jgi:hypothetical protein
LEYETTAIDLKTHFNRRMFSLQQKKTLFKYDSPLGCTSTLTKDVELDSDHSRIVSTGDDPIVKIKLDLNDETMEVHSEDDENSLPEIFFKRIIAPESECLHTSIINRFFILN